MQVQTILARLPKPMHGSCERMDGRLQRDTRVYYWQQTGAPAPNGPGARTSRDRTVKLQRHVNANMDKLQRLMRVGDPQARHEQVSSADMGGSGEVDDTVLDEMLNFSDLLCAPGSMVPLRHALIGYDTSELAGWHGSRKGGWHAPTMGDREHRELLARWYTYLLFYLLILVLLLPTNHSQVAPSLSFHFRILTHAFDQQRIMPLAHAIGTSCWCSCC